MVNWTEIRKHNKKKREEFKEYIGEELEGYEVSKEEKEYYGRIREIVETTFNTVPAGSYEAEYRKTMSKELSKRGMKVREELTQVIEGERGYTKLVRLDICDESISEEKVIFELKKRSVKSAVKQIVSYIRELDCVIGFLVSYREKDYELYMFLKEEVIEGCEYISYDGEKVYKHKY